MIFEKNVTINISHYVSGSYGQNGIIRRVTESNSDKKTRTPGTREKTMFEKLRLTGKV